MTAKSDASSMKCTTCGTRIENQKNWVEFDCPGCSNGKIIRCERCRTLMNVYRCAACDFVGP